MTHITPDTSPAWQGGHKGTLETGRDLLADVSLPAAVIHEAPLAHNLTWMQDFARRHRAELAPHGKTTMTPALFRRQLEAGAWGITLATLPQCRAAFAEGATRLLLANQLVGHANMAIAVELVRAGAELYVTVDGHANVAELGEVFAAAGLALPVLIEVGVDGGRCGCRRDEDVMALARDIAARPGLMLAGLEGYEGVVHGDDPEAGIRAYAERLVAGVRRIAQEGLFGVEAPIVTASGSAWYDLIAEAFRDGGLEGRFTPVLRPGCYVVHDHGIYREAQRGVLSRRPDLHEGLRPALEVYAQVQSLPEPGLAIVALGKRDIGVDQLPEPLARYREGGSVAEPLSVDGWRVTKLMDQHAFIALPEGAGDVRVGDVRVGDIIAFGASHPCLTFDKWRRIHLVDERLNVIDTWATYF
ncbi:amino acid deaminase [Halomonas organivorans]|uniref:D-serine deaminase-like pyridoxal phosphate-dependent protein n=1 Tax=Halomonas organivorans TaxID=257772 RepID=A0A7W5G3Y1_9GAMM|nr:amino acid deaminase [Halomonas organivorans]MBB3139549.1 D-serine deaminase-like pyridoxal phosphate-dependent protein [Halomonas organivorans]